LFKQSVPIDDPTRKWILSLFRLWKTTFQYGILFPNAFFIVFISHWSWCYKTLHKSWDLRRWETTAGLL